MNITHTIYDANIHLNIIARLAENKQPNDQQSLLITLGNIERLKLAQTIHRATFNIEYHAYNIDDELFKLTCNTVALMNNIVEFNNRAQNTFEHKVLLNDGKIKPVQTNYIWEDYTPTYNKKPKIIPNKKFSYNEFDPVGFELANANYEDRYPDCLDSATTSLYPTFIRKNWDVRIPRKHTYRGWSDNAGNIHIKMVSPQNFCNIPCHLLRETYPEVTGMLRDVANGRRTKITIDGHGTCVQRTSDGTPQTGAYFPHESPNATDNMHKLRRPHTLNFGNLNTTVARTMLPHRTKISDKEYRFIKQKLMEARCHMLYNTKTQTLIIPSQTTINLMQFEYKSNPTKTKETKRVLGIKDIEQKYEERLERTYLRVYALDLGKYQETQRRVQKLTLKGKKKYLPEHNVQQKTTVNSWQADNRTIQWMKNTTATEQPNNIQQNWAEAAQSQYPQMETNYWPQNIQGQLQQVPESEHYFHSQYQMAWTHLVNANYSNTSAGLQETNVPMEHTQMEIVHPPYHQNIGGYNQ